MLTTYLEIFSLHYYPFSINKEKYPRHIPDNEQAQYEPSSVFKLIKTYRDELYQTWCSGPYLIFVIFFTQTRFLENKIYTEERVNYDKRISRQNSVNQDLQITKNRQITLCV